VTAVAPKRWHVGDYGALGWAETAVKAVAFAIAFVALAHALDRELARPHGIHAFELILLGVAELGLILAVGDRLIERELIAMGFVLLANAAHLGMLFAILSVPGPGVLLSLFCALMFAGEVIKLGFLRTTDFRVREVAPVVVQGLVVAYAVIYAVALVVWQFA
jgi:hypothetical protein